MPSKGSLTCNEYFPQPNKCKITVSHSENRANYLNMGFISEIRRCTSYEAMGKLVNGTDRILVTVNHHILLTTITCQQAFSMQTFRPESFSKIYYITYAAFSPENGAI